MKLLVYNALNLKRITLQTSTNEELRETGNNTVSILYVHFAITQTSIILKQKQKDWNY